VVIVVNPGAVIFELNPLLAVVAGLFWVAPTPPAPTDIVYIVPPTSVADPVDNPPPPPPPPP
jgi:hypothetical protein